MIENSIWLEQPKVSVLDHGEITLVSAMAHDLDVINAARVSFNKHSDQMVEGDEKLIRFLLRNRHGTPFEHNFFKFRIKAPIFVFREWHRHRIGHSYNEWSARYSELKPEFYIPEAENVRKQVGKPGHYTYEPVDSKLAEFFRNELLNSSQDSYAKYQWALSNFAKEQARLFLPVNIYSEMYWTCNARSLMHFLGLRNADSAQWEIRQYAIEIENVFSKIMPITHKYFSENERVAP